MTDQQSRQYGPMTDAEQLERLGTTDVDKMRHKTRDLLRTADIRIDFEYHDADQRFVFDRPRDASCHVMSMSMSYGEFDSYIAGLMDGASVVNRKALRATFRWKRS